ncbi:2Fe-2S iron-sulfur cluster-binding protein, partial [Candidatus Pelagibacter sp.]|nr:2Fe-2S iron-sulfur cluster-binding protein [Candidatus Pelagibacter sp.]
MSDLRVHKTKYINETRRVSFKYDGKNYFGYEGDTLASALLANGVHLIGRSFKYHRPRGIMSCGSEEPNAICQISDKKDFTEPNVRATELEIYEGLEAFSQNCWPNVQFDIGGINNLISPLIPAGFYYKTFMWPKSFWKKVYEPLIRISAGLGKSPTEPDPDIYDHKYVHYDVLVIGGGLSGIISAKIAAKSNLKTLLVDDKKTLGGSTIYQTSDNFKIDDQYSSDWLENEINEISKIDNLTIKTRTSIAAYHGYNYLLARENLTDHLSIKDKKDKIRQRLWKIRAKKVIIATGAIERPLVFNNNDRPGILLSNSINKYLDYYGVACGRNIIIFTNNDSAYETAISLHKKGIKSLIVDLRKNSQSKIAKQAETLGIKIYFNHVVTNTFGYRRINSVELMELSDDGNTTIGNKIKLNCDCLGISGGWTPMVHMHTQSGGKLDFKNDDQVFIPKENDNDQISVGACNGDLGALHSKWNCIPGKFKDYISSPKINNYKSIHTAIIGPNQRPIEIQLRTSQMHEFAQRGIASHWKYKSSEKFNSLTWKEYDWLADLVEIIDKNENPEHYYEYTKLQMFQENVFCFTPKGSVIKLPKNATPIDFAYAVHTQVGDTAVGCEVNGNEQALQSVLRNGDVVKIITSKKVSPSLHWLTSTKTGKARAAIRRYWQYRENTKPLKQKRYNTTL